MKSVSVLCPDDRVALARRGLLSAEEWPDFATHLTECVDCRLAWRLGNDFEHSGAARPGDERIIARGVKAALATSARPHTRLVRLAIAAAVTLVAAGAASAAIALHARYRASLANPDATAAPGKTRPPKGRGGAHRAVAPTSADSPVAPVAENAPPPAEPPSAAPPPAAAAPTPPPVTRTPPRPTRLSQLEAADPFDGDRGPTAPALAPPPQREDAVGLFAQALVERQEGRHQTAIASFRRLQREFPASQEATVSLVSLGDLLLGAGLRTDALLAFETYLQRAPRGTLAPEALIGKARALAASGRASEARAAWSEIARRFPSSAYGGRALDGRSDAR